MYGDGAHLTFARHWVRAFGTALIASTRTKSVCSGCRTRTQRRAAMDWNRVEGNWKEMKGKVKEQ